jgi:sugar phosphate isomerase/epimerase
MIRLAVSTICFKDRSLREALECVAQSGCPSVELVALGQTYIDVEQTTAEELGEALAEAGVNLVALYPRPLDVVSPERLEATVSHVCRAADVAAELGCPRIVFSPLLPREGYDYGKLIEACRRVAEHIGGRDITVCLENHAGWPLSEIGDYERIEELFDDQRLGITADTGHFSTAGVDLVQFAERFGSAIKHVHLKDRVGSEAVRFGQGETDNEGFLRKLRESGYDGLATLELEPGEGSVSVEEVGAAVAYARDVLGITTSP